MNMIPTYSVWVDGEEIKSGMNRQDAEDLRKSVAGIVKETTPVATTKTKRETQ